MVRCEFQPAVPQRAAPPSAVFRRAGRLAVWTAAWLVALAPRPALSAEPLLPHVYRSGLSLGPYGGTVSRAVTYWKGMVYVSVDAETCYVGRPESAYTLYAVDVSDPDHLSYLSKGNEGGCKANGLVAWEDKLYVAHWFTFLTVWDVAVPGAFNLLGEYSVPAQATWSIDAADDRVYLGMGIETLKSFYIMDVSDPAHPQEISHTDWKGGTAVRGSYSFYTDGPWFKVLNISDERNPWDVAAVHAGGNVGEVTLRDRYAFVKLGWPPDPQTGMIIYDVYDPTQPVEIGRWIAHASYGLRGIYLLGDLAFLPTSGNGVFTVDVSNPAQPVTRAQFDVPYYSLELALTGNGPFLYVGTAEEGGGVHCFQVLTGDPDDTGPGRWSGCSLGEASWDYQYEGNALPTLADAGWELVEGLESWATAADGVLRINDNSSVAGSKVKWARNWDASNSRGTTVLTRARCASYNSGGSPLGFLGNIYVRDGRFAEEFSILSDRVRACRANLEFPLDGTAWHTYRITTRDTQFQIFVDEADTPVLIGPLFVDRSQDPVAARARVMIGSGSSAGQQDISFDYVHCFTGGTVSPPPRVRGQEPTISVRVADSVGKGSLSGINPATARVMWSTDGGVTWSSSGGPLWQAAYEADQLPTASVPAWSVAEGDESPASVAGGILRVNDASTASGSKIKWERQWNATPGGATTVLTRIRCTSVGGDTTYLSNVFVEDGLHGQSFRIMPDRLTAVESGLTVTLDGTQWHTYRFTTSGAQFQVYVDENPTPALAGPFTSATSNNRVMFGSGASAGMQDIYFDYVRYYTAGDLPPGQGDGGGPVTVTCTPVSPFLPMDRGEIVASRIPLHQSSAFLNKVRFSLQDMAGNVGLSPIYTVRNGWIPDFDADGDVDQSDFGHLQACLSADVIPATSACEDADLDGDGYCGSGDLEILRQCMGGADAPPSCPG